MGGGLGMLMPLVIFVPLIVMMYWTSRNQTKKQKELEDKLKTGDHVVTQSGLIGKVRSRRGPFAKRIARADS